MSLQVDHLWKQVTIDEGVGVDNILPPKQVKVDPLEIEIPPDSYWLPKEHEIEWFDHNAFIQRKGSLKLPLPAVNSAHHHHYHPKSSSSQSSSSLLIGFPNTQKPSCAELNLRRNCKAAGGNPRLFRTRSEPERKWVSHQGLEPGSPSVSCIGRVASKKGKQDRSGFWRSVIKSVFRGRCGGATRVLELERTNGGGGLESGRMSDSSLRSGVVDWVGKGTDG